MVLFSLLFCKLNLAIFSRIIYNNVNGQGIPCGLNFYSFIPILPKLHWRFGHGLEICMRFGYNPQIMFLLLFHMLNLAIFPAFSIAK